MFQFVCNKLLHRKPAFRLSCRHRLPFLQLHHFSTSSESIPEPLISEEDRRLFTIDYLTKTCGLSPERAESVSRTFNFKTQKPDSVVSFFENQGFTGTQISTLIRIDPRLLQRNPDKNLLPKVEFFRSLGLSTKDIALLISNGGCTVIRRSLAKQIMPLYRYISTLLQSPENALVCIKRFVTILSLDLEGVVIPNVGYLSEVGVPQENVVTFVRNYPIAISYKHDRFRNAVDEVKSMGFDPKTASFGVAVHVFGWNSESSWRKKVEIYKSFGLSDANVIEAFRRHPLCMIFSTDKIFKTMDFLVNRMGFEPSFLMKWPVVVCFSLEKRIVPRCIVYQALSAKGLVPKKFTLRLLLESQEEKFQSTFVEPFEAQIAGLRMMMSINNGSNRNYIEVNI